jgi:hypothetical protein
MTMGTFLISLVMVFIWTSLDHSVAGRKPASAYAKDQTEQVSQVDPALAMKDYQYSAVVPERVKAFIRIYNSKMLDEDMELLIQSTVSTSESQNIDPLLMFALMARESSFNPKAKSSTGAMGLGQIKPFNYSALNISDPTQIDQGARGTVLYFGQMLKPWKTHPRPIQMALASYKEGYGAVSRSGGQYSAETNQYIQDILKLRGQI